MDRDKKTLRCNEEIILFQHSRVKDYQLSIQA